MTDKFTIQLTSWAHGSPIPAKYAFGQPGEKEPFAPSDNINPAIQWANAPAGTKSFVLIAHDPDVPSSGEDVNQAGREVPADLARVDFFHWVLTDIPVEAEGITEGSASRGITPRGKNIGATESGVTGKNDYTSWFSGDADMAGVYGSYDGPCPPWNDSIVHHYYFTLYALDVPSLGLTGAFSGADALENLKGHILAEAAHMGTYSMNPRVPA